MRDRRGVEPTNLLAVERCGRARIERGAAERIERRQRAVHVYRRRSVERQIHFFFVFVLPEKSEAAGAARGRDERRRTDKP